MTSIHDRSPIDGRLRFELRRLGLRMQARRLHRRSAIAWLIFAASALAMTGLAWLLGLSPGLLIIALGVACAGCGWMVARWWSAPADNTTEAGALVEQMHPELRQSLRTALELRPDAAGRYTFLQARVINEALDHAQRHFWSRIPLRGARAAAAWHATAFLATAVVLFVAVRSVPKLHQQHIAQAARPASAALEIVPGNAEVERGSTVVFTARFGTRVPGEAVLRWTAGDGSEHSRPMVRSLADPVFATTIQHLAQDINYSVAFDADASPEYRISVYDLPAMTRGDAALEYPEFTGLAPRTIEDTRRVSAVEGTRLDYSIQTNKPVRDARLRAADGTEIALSPANPERTRFSTTMTIAESARYAVHLADDAGRTNPAPPEVRIEALPNRRPDLKVEFPRGDQRVSALEEITLQATAADDFGLLDYGIAWSVGDAEPHYSSLRPESQPGSAASPAGSVRRVSFEQLLALEAHGAEPNQLVTWFAWADDMGSDGKPRRSTSDLFFAEVRPFDESFRESEGENAANNGQSGGGDAAADLLEMQRDISIAIWKLRNQAPDTDAFANDATTILTAQREARRQLLELSTQLPDARMQSAATEAGRQMDRAGDRLDESREQSSTAPLTAAWTSSQGAYQALLRMQSDTTQVGRERDRGNNSGRSRNNRRQLDQLRFKDNEDRYETERQAQASNTTPEQREQMQALARLRELAQRQGDMNERLQQLQTALEAARDEAERQEIERELKRLEDEQRRMLADLDELRQRVDTQAQQDAAGTEVREQMEQTREDMRRASEALEEGAVSRALASGTRARERLEQAREEMRNSSASEFSEAMRELRRDARDLAQAQARTEEQLAEAQRTTAPSLDNSGQREELAQAIDQNKESLQQLTEELRQVTEDAEEAEPGLHRQLYDLLRDQGQGGGARDSMEASAELMRRGFVDQAREIQPTITESLNQLARGVERAAESVLGDETSTLRFAQTELDDLAREVDGGNPPPEEPPASDARGEASSASSQEAAGAAASEDELGRALAELSGEAGGNGGGRDNPLTDGDFGDWEERLRTVQSLLDQPEARGRLAGARELAAGMRRDYRRDGTPPRPADVETGIVAPLSEVRGWLRQELARRDDPASLQPIDRDPVPDGYAEAVQRYYEALGASNVER